MTEFCTFHNLRKWKRFLDPSFPMIQKVPRSNGGLDWLTMIYIYIYISLVSNITQSRFLLADIANKLADCQACQASASVKFESTRGYIELTYVSEFFHCRELEDRELEARNSIFRELEKFIWNGTGQKGSHFLNTVNHGAETFLDQKIARRRFFLLYKIIERRLFHEPWKFRMTGAVSDKSCQLAYPTKYCETFVSFCFFCFELYPILI